MNKRLWNGYGTVMERLRNGYGTAMERRAANSERPMNISARMDYYRQLITHPSSFASFRVGLLIARPRPPRPFNSVNPAMAPLFPCLSGGVGSLKELTAPRPGYPREAGGSARAVAGRGD